MAQDSQEVPTVYDIEGEELREGAAVIFEGEEMTVKSVERTPSGAVVFLRAALGHGCAYEVWGDMRCPHILQLDDDERGDGKTSG
jgi:hypothetical protein